MNHPYKLFWMVQGGGAGEHFHWNHAGGCNDSSAYEFTYCMDVGLSYYSPSFRKGALKIIEREKNVHFQGPKCPKCVFFCCIA